MQLELTRFGDYLPYPSQILQMRIKDKLEENFLKIIESTLDENLLRHSENQLLIKREGRMKIEPSYSPICDVTVGPFAFEDTRLNEIYNILVDLDSIRQFIEGLQRRSLGSGQNALLDLNENPRCFIAIEVENTTARDVKHLLGSISNCSFLGKIGIVVVFDEYLRYAERLLQYLAFLKRVEKTKKELFGNVFVIPSSRMKELLQIYE